MASILAMGQNGKAVTTHKTFSRTTEVSTTIQAQSDIIWKLLTNAEQFPKWNSTVVSIDGKIEEGATIKLKSTLDESRTFKLKVKEVVPEQSMIWADMMGKRVYTLTKTEGGVVFNMIEKIGGPIFPLFAKKIPSFDETFEQFAKDLKQKAESLQQSTNR